MRRFHITTSNTSITSLWGDFCANIIMAHRGMKKHDFHHWGYDLHMTFKWLLTFKMSFKPKKQWQILNVCFPIFPMIYNMSGNEKFDFLSFFKYELQNGFKMTLKPKNNYIFLKHKLSAFQWYITCHDIRKLNFWHFLMYELQNGFKITLKSKNNYRILKHTL